ncbi:MAG: glycosyltransferase [Candidatus Omnitrophota bacterium]
MKILFVGYHNPKFIALPEYFENAIVNLGHELVSFDDRKFIFPGRVRGKINVLQKWELDRINSNLLKLVLHKKPDICLVNSVGRIKVEIIQKIKQLGVRTAYLTTDFPWDSDVLVQEALNYEFVFYGGTEIAQKFKQANIKKAFWLPFACDPDLHKPVELSSEEKKQYSADIAFVGSIYPKLYSNRLIILEGISDFNIKVWGPGADTVSANSPLKKKIMGNDTKPGQWQKIYSAVKIGVCIHFEDHLKKIPCYQASPRIYELLSCKCFTLVDNQVDVSKLFEDGKHLVIFKSIPDLREKINYYLAHPEKRKIIAEQGFNEVINNHTYQHRIKKIIAIIRGDNQ